MCGSCGAGEVCLAAATALYSVQSIQAGDIENATEEIIAEGTVSVKEPLWATKTEGNAVLPSALFNLDPNQVAAIP